MSIRTTDETNVMRVLELERESKGLPVTVALGKWKSKTSDLVAMVERVDDRGVWYTIPQWNKLCNCRIDIFLGSMEKLNEEEN